MQFPPDDDPQPLILGRYRRQATLVQYDGEVVRAVDVHLGHVVAIKTLRPDLSSLHMETVFEREAEVAARMGVHPNVVTIYDLDRDALGTCLIMEYISGDTLRDRLRPALDTIKALPLTEALQITGDVARGLHAAHLYRIVHCDVTPNTIFLTAWGQAKIGDFGLAQVDEHMIVRGYTHALYASPEQMMGTSPLGPGTDQYRLGLVLFEMLTGVAYRPLRAQEVQERLAAFPPPVRALIERMMAGQPGDRYPSMDEVVTAIAALMNTRKVTGYWW